MGRKGLNKFFDLCYEFISPTERFLDEKLSVVKQNLKNYIMAGALKSILSGFQVEVIKTLKANGENAQVSWNSVVKAWVIASKNVGMLARTREDVEKADPSR